MRETTWEHARRTVEAVCLDVIVKWRGDEENGRDQLDTILREVVVISDSEDDDEEESEEDSDVPVVVSPPGAEPARVAINAVEGPEAALASLAINVRPQSRDHTAAPVKPAMPKVPTTPLRTKGNARLSKRARKAAKKAQRGFSRYQAAWDQAMERRRHEEVPGHPPQGTPLARSTSNGRLPPTSLDYSPAYSPYAAHPTRANNEVIYLGPARSLGPANANAPTFERRPAALEAAGYSPSARGSRAVYREEAQARSTQVMTRSYTNAAFPAQKQPEPRYKDLLVRSIETPNPTPVSMTPRFVRALPPRKHARDESPDEYQAREYPPAQSYGSSAPVDIIQDHHLKRRRVISDHDGIPTATPGVYPQDDHSRYPPEPAHRVIQARYPPSYATLDREPQMREQAPARPMFYEIRSEPGAARDQPVVVHHSGATLRYADELVEVRRAVPEVRQYAGHRIAATGERTVLRHPSGMGAAPGRPYYEDPGYRPSHSDPSQAPRVSMQPIFVRPVDRQPSESSRPQDPIYSHQEIARAAPEPRRLGQEVYAPHPHQIEP